MFQLRIKDCTQRCNPYSARLLWLDRVIVLWDELTTLSAGGTCIKSISNNLFFMTIYKCMSQNLL